MLRKKAPSILGRKHLFAASAFNIQTHARICLEQLFQGHHIATLVIFLYATTTKLWNFFTMAISNDQSCFPEKVHHQPSYLPTQRFEIPSVHMWTRQKAHGPRLGRFEKVQAQAGPNTGQYCNATCWKEIPLLPVMSIWVRKNYLAASPYPCGYVHRVALAKRVPIFSHILWFHLTLVSWMLWCSLHDHLPPVQPQILIPSISNFLKGTKFGHFDFPITRHDDMCLGVHTMFTHNAHAAHSWQNHFTPPQSNQSFVHTNAM